MSIPLIHPFLILIAHIVNSQLVEEIDYLKVENRILRSKLGRRVTLTPEERERLLKFGMPLGDRIKNIISVVTYRTFRNWVADKEYRGIQNRRGRPALNKVIVEIILRMAKENNWGYRRIVGELKKLSIRVSRSSIQNVLHENQFEPTPMRLDPTWKKFIEMHMNTLIACDFFTKPVWTLHGRIDMYVLFFIELGSRRVHIAGMTPNPNQCWVEQRTVETISKMHDAGFYPRYLIRDRDGKYSKQMDIAVESLGVKTVKTPPRSPICNVFSERFVWAIKHECLNYFTVFGRDHLKYLVSCYADYYNTLRPHQGIGNVPIGSPSGGDSGTHSDVGMDKVNNSISHSEVGSISILGGLHHHYYRKAA